MSMNVITIQSDAKIERCTGCGGWRYVEKDCINCRIMAGSKR